jgi:hypothetical protein
MWTLRNPFRNELHYEGFHADALQEDEGVGAKRSLMPGNNFFGT